MAEHYADRLVAAIRHKVAPVCVGIDPVLERLPAAISKSVTSEPQSQAAALLSFGSEIARVVAPHVPAVKINSAFFERYGGAGFDAYFELSRRCAELDLLVIGDCKRGDVGHTAVQYAGSQFDPPGREARSLDAVTLHPYLGWDAIEPFCQHAQDTGRGMYILVQTSNPSAVHIQGFRGPDGQTLSEHVGAIVQDWASAPQRVGSSGYSCIGAVVAPRDVELAGRLRQLMPACPFLVPGYGAQGAGAAEVAACFNDDGSGAIVNASRSVIYAFANAADGASWQRAVERACRALVQDVAGVVGLTR